MGQEQENRDFFTCSRYCANNGTCLDSIYTSAAGAVFTREVHGESISSQCDVLPLLTTLWEEHGLTELDVRLWRKYSDTSALEFLNCILREASIRSLCNQRQGYNGNGTWQKLISSLLLPRHYWRQHQPLPQSDQGAGIQARRLQLYEEASSGGPYSE